MNLAQAQDIQTCEDPPAALVTFGGHQTVQIFGDQARQFLEAIRRLPTFPLNGHRKG